MLVGLRLLVAYLCVLYVLLGVKLVLLGVWLWLLVVMLLVWRTDRELMLLLGVGRR